MQSSTTLHIPLANFPYFLRQAVLHLKSLHCNWYNVSSHILASITFNGPSFSMLHTYTKIFNILNHEFQDQQNLKEKMSLKN